MSTLLIGLAMNIFFGGPECKVEYSLGMPDHWYVLDVGGMNELYDYDVIRDVDGAIAMYTEGGS